MLIDYVYQDKLATKLKRLISQAKFRFKEADGNSIIYEQRQLDQKKILNLLSCQFLETFTNVIITDFTGADKTFLECAIGIAFDRRIGDFLTCYCPVIHLVAPPLKNAA